MLFSIMVLSKSLIMMENVPDKLLNVLFFVSEDKLIILIFINLFLIILGMLIGDASAMVLTMPILLPLTQSLGVDLIYYAAIIGVNLGMRAVIPSTASLLF